jgi:hypothetical protein
VLERAAGIHKHSIGKNTPRHSPQLILYCPLSSLVIVYQQLRTGERQESFVLRLGMGNSPYVCIYIFIF